jgi:hypothetical protein
MDKIGDERYSKMQSLHKLTQSKDASVAEGAQKELDKLKAISGVKDDMAVDEMLRKESRASAMEKFDRAMDIMKEKFSANFEGIGGLMDGLADFGMLVAQKGLMGAMTASNEDVAIAKGQNIAAKQTEIAQQLQTGKGTDGKALTPEETKSLTAELQKLSSEMTEVTKEYNDNVGLLSKRNDKEMQSASLRLNLSEKLAETETSDKMEVRKQAYKQNQIIRDTPKIEVEQQAENDFSVIKPHVFDNVTVSPERSEGSTDRMEKKFDELIAAFAKVSETPINLQFSDGTVQKISDRSGFINKISAGLGLG